MSDTGTGFVDGARITKLSGAQRVADFLLR